jgi:hypothetical protein
METLVRTIAIELGSTIARDLVRALVRRRRDRRASLDRTDPTRCAECGAPKAQVTAMARIPDPRILSSMPGRVRLGLPALRGQRGVAASVAVAMAAMDGILEARANPLTGSLVLRFDSAHLTDVLVLAAAMIATDAAASGGNAPTSVRPHLALLAPTG